MPNFDHTPTGAHRDQLLRDRLVAWLSTVRPDGSPHLVPVWFLWNGAEILITTTPGAQKVANIASNPHVSVALDDSNHGHAPVILAGTATLEPVIAGDPDVEAYFTKYRPSYEAMDWDEADARAEFTQLIRIHVGRFVIF